MQTTDKPYYLNYRHSRTGWSCRDHFQTVAEAVAFRLEMGLDRKQCRIMTHIDGHPSPVFPLPRNPS